MTPQAYTETAADRSRGESPSLTLRLYIADGAPNSSAAQANLRAILQRFPDVRYDLEVVDSLKQPQRALADGVIVTPMLVKISPPPTRRVIGTLSEPDPVVAALGLPAAQHV